MTTAEDRPDLASGDPRVVFAGLFDRYAEQLRRYVAGRIGRHAADDVVAETFVVALRRRADYDPERGTVRAWLYGIATNQLRNHIRQEVRNFELTSRARIVDQHVDGHDTVVAGRVDADTRISSVAGAIADLSPVDRDVLLLTSWTGLGPAEIAAALDMPASTVRSRLFRVRHRLQLLLSQTADVRRRESS